MISVGARNTLAHLADQAMIAHGLEPYFSQYKSYINQQESAYSYDELRDLAQYLTKQEEAAFKIERQLDKSAAAIVLTSQIGNLFNGIITGTSEKGTWVRTLQPAVEGKIVKGLTAQKVGDRVKVKLIKTDVQKGHIDFEML